MQIIPRGARTDGRCRHVFREERFICGNDRCLNLRRRHFDALFRQFHLSQEAALADALTLELQLAILLEPLAKARDPKREFNLCLLRFEILLRY